MDGLRDLYQDVILEHGRNPRNKGLPADADRRADGRNPNCGDRVSVALRLDGERIAAIGFEGEGCAISMASASMMTDVVKGVETAVALRLFADFRKLCSVAAGDGETVLDGQGLGEDLVDRLKVMAGVRQFPARVKCATLPWAALAAALEGETEASSE
ncbi:MAG: Fe-S cluster assembly sulfur transfer protein SufU [Rhodospirillales bacterium]